MDAEVSRMDDTQSRAWHALLAVSAALPALLDRQLASDTGLIDFEYGILSELGADEERPQRIGDLAAALESSAPRVSKAVTRLERRGLVERAACDADGRAINVRLTHEGCRAWLEATPQRLALARDTVLAGMTDAELRSLAKLLEGILGRLDDRGESCCPTDAAAEAPGSTARSGPPR